MVRTPIIASVDELMQGYKISFSISCPGNLLSAISEFANEERYNLSQATIRLIRLGFTYMEMMAERKRLQELDNTERSLASVKAKRKKRKPKTPSKTN